MEWIEEAVILNGDTSAGQEAARWRDKNVRDGAAWENCELSSVNLKDICKKGIMDLFID